jgi:YidC/Oxa1 family membrane protein insertase
MEQGGLSRWLLIGLLVMLGVFVVPRWFQGDPEPQKLLFEPDRTPAKVSEQHCELTTDTFRAVLSSQGGSIERFQLLQPKYQSHGAPVDLSTTPDVPMRQQLQFGWRNPSAHDAAQQAPFEKDPELFYKAPYWQVAWDIVPFKLEKAEPHACRFVYKDERVELTKIVSTTGRPYELETVARIKNLADKPLRHALTVNTAAWRTTKEVSGSMFTVSPWITHTECVAPDGAATRLKPDAFEGKDFADSHFAPNELHRGDWYDVAGRTDLAGVSNAYFSHAVLPLGGPVEPRCQMQIEEWGKKGDPQAGAMYRARLAYPRVDLKPNQQVEYKVLTYVGPKERAVLAAAGGGQRQLDELIDLGFFSVIAKILVAFLLKVYSVIPNWGIAIVVLTITARVLLFPLSIPMIQSSLKMREIKPEMDALNEKFKDDPQQRGLAQMELWRKHKINPVKGCLPQLATLPVWLALYTSLQTAVELYNIPFLWFPNLAAPDPLFILPLIIGSTSYVQQKLMPMTGGDPAQQKMMLYMMPAMFTVFMLFLPAGLGVYMFTNSVLGIAQQMVVESVIKRRNAAREAAPSTPASVGTKKSQA